MSGSQKHRAVTPATQINVFWLNPLTHSNVPPPIKNPPISMTNFRP